MFIPARTDARYCNHACRQMAYHARRRSLAAGGVFGSSGALRASIAAICPHCGRAFYPNRVNADGPFCGRHCADAAAAHPPPGRYALIVWRTDGDMTARYSYFHTRAEAEQAAPRGGVPFTIADRAAKPRRERLSIDEIVGRIARA
jgi:hypothetical protein